MVGDEFLGERECRGTIACIAKGPHGEQEPVGPAVGLRMRCSQLLIGLRRIGIFTEREEGIGPIGGEVEECIGRDIGAALGGGERLARAIGRGLRRPAWRRG